MAALTRRERKVRRILLKELRHMSVFKMLSYADKKHLKEALDVEYIDEELAKMRKALKTAQWWQYILTPIAVFSILASLFSLLILGHSFDFQVHAYWQLLAVTYAMWPVITKRSTRRRMFIFEALRELSDADEVDVTLDRITRDADALIEQVVDEVLAMEKGRTPVTFSKTAHPPASREAMPLPTAPRPAAIDVDDPTLSIAEIQRRKEAGSTILSDPY